MRSLVFSRIGLFIDLPSIIYYAHFFYIKSYLNLLESEIFVCIVHILFPQRNYDVNTIILNIPIGIRTFRVASCSSLRGTTLIQTFCLV